MCSATSGRAQTGCGGGTATGRLGGTSLSLFSRRAWGPVVPSRLWGRLGSALHDEKSHWGGFHVSLERNEAKLKILPVSHQEI